MKSVYMICGIGSAGKSTYAKKLKKEIQEKEPCKKVVICSVDEQRPKGAMVSIEEAKEKFVEKTKKVFNDYDVIITDFSFDCAYSRKWFLDSVNFDYNIDFHCIFLKIPIEQIIKNNYDRNPKYILTKEKEDRLNQLCAYNGIPVKEEFNFYKTTIKIITEFKK